MLFIEILIFACVFPVLFFHILFSTSDSTFLGVFHDLFFNDSTCFNDKLVPNIHLYLVFLVVQITVSYHSGITGILQNDFLQYYSL